ncbi:MAG: recombinase family protein [Propionibacterium freudenreichii]|uniref:recombinase family protein n=3 Tax=Propionibacterium freudenreichii TaxID=1744 RepID=UPI000BEF1143|nr:recombinase family protein [Propionibacterium freudenreichii]MDK9322181.1 recombinase family protein [Propionibacterium freudenreichii]
MSRGYRHVCRDERVQIEKWRDQGHSMRQIAARLGRSLIDVLNTVDLLQNRGVTIRSIRDGIDPDTTTGRLMLGMLATLAEYERDLFGERVAAGIAAARAQGTRFGRPPADPEVVDRKLAIAAERARGRTAEQAARLVGWSRATLYRHQHEAELRHAVTPSRT